MNKFIDNKYILYILCFLAITNLLGFLYVKDYDSIVLLFALVIVTSYFSNNNIIQLAVGLIGTNFVFVNRKVAEGFFKQKLEQFKNREGFDKEDGKDNDQSSNDYDDSSDDDDNSSDHDDSSGDDDNNNENSMEKFKGKRRKSGFKKGRREKFSTKNKIDQSSTLKEAYSNISNILGKGGINNLTKETQQLVKQQKDLVKQMASLGPMIANVSSLAKNMPNMGGMLKGITNK
tara:strand:- start:318 stop:1013 length:696 start_codon:yes stop_codon:yes gene_type:complete